MRLWTLHPSYLDVRGLCGLWREALLAQKVLRGETVGYRSHPQLIRFKAQPQPLDAITTYLQHIYAEGRRRGYHFDPGKLSEPAAPPPIPVTRGQLLYEWQHFLDKLAKRAPHLYLQYENVPGPDHHPLFFVVEGEVEPWEIKISD
jgi:hypothetical protein